MSDLDFARGFDADAHAAFEEAGLGAVSGSYLPAGSGQSLEDPVRAYVNRAGGSLGEYRQVRVEQVTVQYVLADVAPEAGDRFITGTDTWENVEELDNDGSLATWAVRCV